LSNGLTKEELCELGSQVVTYCSDYSIPLAHFMAIIHDQKVVPMLRGKGMEFAIYDLLTSTLDPDEWAVEKPDLNAQPGQLDIDVDIIHLETGEHLNVESKSSVRGSMKSGRTTRKCKVPHYKIKCHRSRSNKSLGTVGSDRYKVGDFDIVIANPFNAIVAEGGAKSKKGKAIDDEAAMQLSLEVAEGETLEPEKVAALPLIDDREVLAILFRHYGVTDKIALFEKASADFRFALSTDIAEDGFIPHDPIVILSDDPRWRPLEELPEVAGEVARQRAASRKTRRSS
jgi:hypothetical protein